MMLPIEVHLSEVRHLEDYAAGIKNEIVRLKDALDETERKLKIYRRKIVMAQEDGLTVFDYESLNIRFPH